MEAWKMIEVTPSCSEWKQLSRAAEKREAFSKDLYFRECWRDVVDVLGERATRVIESIAMLNVKPDAVVGRRMTSVLKFATDRGFLPTGCAPVRLTRHSMRELWRHDWHVYPADRLAFSTFWYTSTEILVMLLRDLRPEGSLPGSVRLSRLKGHALAEKRTAGDLRTVLRPPNGVLNFVHVADEPADVVRELGIFFDRPGRRALLKKIGDAAVVNRQNEVSDLIGELEGRYAEHDLDLAASLRRLEEAAAVSSESARRLRQLHQNGEVLSWDELCSLINPAAANVNRWDFICVASNLIPLSRDL